MNKIKLFAILTLIVLTGCAQKLDNKVEICKSEDTGVEMSILEAREIALNSECGGNGSLKDEYYCNAETATWWIDLEPNEETKGCDPTCVVNVDTKSAEINWACTGVILSD